MARRSAEDKELAESFDRGEWKSVTNPTREKRKLRDAARCFQHPSQVRVGIADRTEDELATSTV